MHDWTQYTYTVTCGRGRGGRLHWWARAGTDQNITGYGKRPELAIRDWQKQYRLMLKKGERVAS